MFRSIWFYAAPARLAAAITDASLKALEARHGLFVAHTYLSASTTTTHQTAHRHELAVHWTKPGTLAIDPILDDALGRVETHLKTGSLASLTWRDAGDRLRDLDGVEVHYLPDGSALIENHGKDDLAGLTLSVSMRNVEITLDGANLTGSQREADRSTVWFPVAAGSQVKLRAKRDGESVPFLSTQPVTLEAL